MGGGVTQVSPQARAAYDVARYRAAAEQRAARLPAALSAELLQSWDGHLGPVEPDGWRPVRPANTWINQHIEQFRAANVREAYDEDAIRDTAENAARLCSRMGSLESRASFAARYGVEVPSGPKVTRAGAMARMDEPLWWRRQLRRVWTRAAENAMRDLGMIRRGRQPYASDEAVNHRAGRQRRTREWAERRAMVNDAGEQLDLLPLMDRSLANPALRRGEFMCRMRGFEEIARDLGHVALFFTLTAPSAFHAYHSGGGINAAWQDAERPRVQAAQQWLRKMWARARAKLARLSVLLYGFRVAEPHHDATPHWHMVLFTPAAASDSLRTVLRLQWLSEYSGEFGAAEHRCKAITINPEQGSATGYVAKYVSKNIDGAGAIGDEISDETGEKVSDGVRRVAAWASCHGIRQFQQVGGPPVGLWRETRRLRSAVDDRDIERARVAADCGDWAGFIYAISCDHIKAGRRVPLKIERPASRIFAPLEPAANGYGEEKPQPVIGLRYCGAVVITRTHRWRIEKKAAAPASSPACREARRMGSQSCSESSPRSGVFSPLGPVAITVRSDVGPASGDPLAWTSRETSMAGPH